LWPDAGHDRTPKDIDEYLNLYGTFNSCFCLFCCQSLRSRWGGKCSFGKPALRSYAAALDLASTASGNAKATYGDLSRERESSEQFVWYGETEMQLRRWAIMRSIQANWHQDEGI
jgi:hypothetical protein